MARAARCTEELAIQNCTGRYWGVRRPHACAARIEPRRTPPLHSSIAEDPPSTGYASCLPCVVPLAAAADVDATGHSTEAPPALQYRYRPYSARESSPATRLRSYVDIVGFASLVGADAAPQQRHHCPPRPSRRQSLLSLLALIRPRRSGTVRRAWARVEASESEAAGATLPRKARSCALI